MDLPNVNPGDLIKASDINKLSSGLEDLETLILNQASQASRAGVYYNSEGDPVPFVFVASDTDPGPTKTIDDVVYEVWWAQTTPPDPSQWAPKQVTQDIAGRSYTVPTDAGATYTVGGVLRSPGTYAVGSSAVTLAWSATAKSGYTFKSGATTSGSLAFAAKVYGPGDVLFSDTFAREGVLAGSTTDSFEGGEPRVWQNAMTSYSTIRTQGDVAIGVRSATNAGAFSFDDIVLPSPLDRFDIYITAKIVDTAVAANNEVCMWLFNGPTQTCRLGFDGGMVMYKPTPQAFAAPASTVVGDALRYEYRSGQVLKCHNITKGTTSVYTGAYVPTNSPIDTIRYDSRQHNTNSAIGATPREGLDSIKVVIQ